jgi:hypothetical protein
LEGSLRDAFEFAGNARIDVPPLVPGAQISLGISPDSELRRWATAQGNSFLENKFQLDWLGQWVAVGIADVATLPELARKHGQVPELSAASDKTRASESRRGGFPEGAIPVYAALEIQNMGGLAVLLSTLRKAATEALGSSLQWNEIEQYQGRAIFKVALEDISVYFSIAPKRLFIAGDLPVLHQLLDASVASASAKPPQPGNPPAEGFQASVGLRSESPRKSPLLTALVWLLEGELRSLSLSNSGPALALLHGSPAATNPELRARAQKLLGYVPETPEGKLFTLTETGVTDPSRGSLLAPNYPALPIQGSPVLELLSRVLNLRLDVGFDTEPGSPERSLHTRGVLVRVP